MAWPLIKQSDVMPGVEFPEINPENSTPAPGIINDRFWSHAALSRQNTDH